MSRCFYFGVWDKNRLGHHLHAPGGSVAYRHEQVLPFEFRILDAALLSKDDETEGRVRRSVINGWTVLTFWDRSGDCRFGSNSAFVIEGEYDARAGLAFAREQFPSIFARFTFPLEESRP